MSSLEHIVHTNHGILSRAEALACGESDQSLAAARRAGTVVRLRRGWYAPADLYGACDDSGKHLLHARGAVAAQGGAVALAGASAAVLHGFAMYQQDLSVVHLVRLDEGSSRAGSSRPGSGVPVIAGGRSGYADSALRHDPGPADALTELRSVLAYVPGSRGPRTVLALADGHGQLLGTCDRGWDEYRHVGEFDGFARYERLLRPEPNRHRHGRRTRPVGRDPLYAASSCCTQAAGGLEHRQRT